MLRLESWVCHHLPLHKLLTSRALCAHRAPRRLNNSLLFLSTLPRIADQTSQPCAKVCARLCARLERLSGTICNNVWGAARCTGTSSTSAAVLPAGLSLWPRCWQPAARGAGRFVTTLRRRVLSTASARPPAKRCIACQQTRLSQTATSTAQTPAWLRLRCAPTRNICRLRFPPRLHPLVQRLRWDGPGRNST